MITGLAGVLLWTEENRFPALAAFYTELLGLTPRSTRDDFINFDFGDVRLSIGVHSQVQGPAIDPLRVMVNLVATDLDAMHMRLNDAGVPNLRPPELESWGGRVATYQDPDGNVIQLFEMP